MIIDFHTHTFPENIAERTIRKLSESSNLKNYINGTLSDLKDSMKIAGIDYSVVLPVTTNPTQEETINRVALEINEHSEETGILSFGGIHPDNANYREILQNLASNGVKGIKLHPVFQQVDFDDIRYMRIVECACEHGLIVLVHGGYDISFPEQAQVIPSKVLRLVEEVNPDKLVVAHMGGWYCWNEVEELLVGKKIWFDTSFSLTRTNITNPQTPVLSTKQFVRMIKNHGSDQILFGSDSPWDGQKEAIETIQKCDLPKDDIDNILGENARKLLNL